LTVKDDLATFEASSQNDVRMSNLDLEKQLCFYGSYHHNKVNIGIHMICVPMILLTSFVLATNSPTLIPTPSFLTIPNLPLNLGTITAISYSAFYVLLEPVAGSVLVPMLLGITALGNYFTSSTNASSTNKVMIALNVLSWIFQFVGHGVFEGRAPALLDNLVQALFLAPFFVWMEVLFYFGYRPELRARVEKAVEKEIQKYSASKANDKANGTAKNGKAQ